MCKKCVKRTLETIGNYMGFNEMGIEIIDAGETYIYHDRANGTLFYNLTTKELLKLVLIHFDKNEVAVMCHDLKGDDLYDALDEWFQYKHDLQKLIKIYNR